MLPRIIIKYIKIFFKSVQFYSLKRKYLHISDIAFLQHKFSSETISTRKANLTILIYLIDLNLTSYLHRIPDNNFVDA